jgi:hypothetical protein
MIVVWIIVAILIGVGIGQLAGFMAVEFLIKPVLFIARLGQCCWERSSVGVATCPDRPCFPCLNLDFIAERYWEPFMAKSTGEGHRVGLVKSCTQTRHRTVTR